METIINFKSRDSRLAGSCLVLLFMLLAAPASIQAQDRIQQYLEIAAEQNPALKARFNEYQSALEKSAQARGLPDPELSFSLFLRPMERYMGEQLGDVSLMQMFPWFGSLKAGEEEASYMAKMRFESFLEAKLDLFFNVRSLWFDLYEREQELELLQEEMELLQSLERLALSTYSSGQGGGAVTRPTVPARGGGGNRQQESGSSAAGSAGGGMSGMNMGASAGSAENNRQSAGGSTAMAGMQGQSGSMVDVLLVQLQIKELENRISLLKKSQKPLKTAFNKLLNRQADAEVVIADTLVPSTPPAALSMVPEEVIASHPMIRMYEWDEQARQAQERMAKLMGRPMFGIGINYMMFRPRAVAAHEMEPMHNGSNMLMPMATITLPVYRKKHNAQQREAAFLQEAAVHQREAAENQLISELDQLLYDYEASLSTLELIGEQLLFTQQAIRLLTTSYSVGNVGMETLIQQRQNLLRYKEQQLREIAAQHKTAAAINRLMSIDL